MKTRYKFVKFDRVGKEIYNSINNKDGTNIGYVLLKNGHYISTPRIVTETEYSLGMLKDIIAFIHQLNKTARPQTPKKQR